MYRIIGKCPGCGKKPWTNWSISYGGWIIGHCRWYSMNENKTVARSTWNEMSAAEFARRAVIDVQ